MALVFHYKDNDSQSSLSHFSEACKNLKLKGDLYERIDMIYVVMDDADCKTLTEEEKLSKIVEGDKFLASWQDWKQQSKGVKCCLCTVGSDWGRLKLVDFVIFCGYELGRKVADEFLSKNFAHSEEEKTQWRKDKLIYVSSNSEEVTECDPTRWEESSNLLKDKEPLAAVQRRVVKVENLLSTIASLNQ